MRMTLKFPMPGELHEIATELWQEAELRANRVSIAARDQAHKRQYHFVSLFLVIFHDFSLAVNIRWQKSAVQEKQVITLFITLFYGYYLFYAIQPPDRVPDI